ncbi:MAG: pitrilysin family protein [Bacillota bacterium]|nr:pitrilysin family protein [Bacillota bacterium]
MINTWTLNSGAKLVIEDIPHLRSAAIGAYINVGSRNEDGAMAGASHFIEHMLFKGTSTRTARNIAESFESMGGQLNAYTAKEYTCVYARTLDEDIHSAVDIIFDMLFNASFAEKDFNTEREVVYEEIGMYEDSPDELIHDVFAQKFWQGNSMGSPILGTVDSLGGMSRDDLFGFYNRHYIPSNMVIAIAGNINPQQLYDEINGIMEKQKQSPLEFVKTKPEHVTPFISTVSKEIEQVQICLAVPGISYFDEDRYTQNVFNTILGGGISSRLFQSLREELGLAYSVFSSATSYSDTGLLGIFIGTGPGKVDKFFEALYTQLEVLLKQGIFEDELNRTKKLMKSSVFLGLESVMNRMNRLGRGILMYDEIVTPEEVMEKIYAVDLEKVHTYIKRILQPGNFSMAAIGDGQHMPVVEQAFQKWWGNR